MEGLVRELRSGATTSAVSGSQSTARGPRLECLLGIVVHLWCGLHCSCWGIVYRKMTRGNQRELARAKNAKKQNEGKKGQASGAKDGNKGLTLEARKQRDAEMMRLKQQKAAGKKDDEGGKK